MQTADIVTDMQPAIRQWETVAANSSRIDAEESHCATYDILLDGSRSLLWNSTSLYLDPWLNGEKSRKPVTMARLITRQRMLGGLVQLRFRNETPEIRLVLVDENRKPMPGPWIAILNTDEVELAWCFDNIAATPDTINLEVLRQAA